MLNDHLLALTLVALTLCAPSMRASAAEQAESEIRAALAAWTQDFNAGKADRVCALFSPELRYDFRGYPERGFDDICARLKRSLADTGRHYAYALEVREILVSGDMAVVRLVWTLTVTLANGQVVTSVEPGMDVFRKGPDGAWKIVRYLAFEAPAAGAQEK